jgi:hypothetical protein
MTKLAINQNSVTKGSYFAAYQQLMKQKHRIDKEIEKTQFHLLKSLSSKNLKVSNNSAKVSKYSKRFKNELTLHEAILKSIEPGKEFKMEDVISTLKNKKYYRTRCKGNGLYVMINNKIHQDKGFKSVGRGAYVYNPSDSTHKVKSVGRPRKMNQSA